MSTNILMPALSPTMTEGTLARWMVKEGDEVSAGDVLAEIETDKATMEVEAVDEGRIAKIVVAAGTENVAVNSVIAVLADEGEDLKEAAASVEAAPAPSPKPAPAPEAKSEPAPVSAPAASPAPAPASAAPAASTKGKGERIFASPLARRLASIEGLDLSAISGSGPHGRIVKADIEAAIASGGAKAAPSVADTKAPAAEAASAPAVAAAANPYEPEFELVKLNNMRKTIAKRLSESKQTVPHFYLSMDCELDELLALRKKLNDRADGAYKLSVNDLIIKAAGIALRKVPAANASWSDEGLKLYKSADVSVAVAIEGGLITPVMRNADGKGLEVISNEMKALAQKARDGKLQPEEYQGGTFSISNLGMFGVKSFEAVINPPQACILAIGAGEQRAVVKDGAVQIATVMTVTLSVDHRAVDGAVGAEYLAAFKKLIEEPLSMLL